MNKWIRALGAVLAVMGSDGVFAQSKTYGPVEHGEDLWDIARKVHPQTDVTRDQVILALLKSNPLAVSVPCNANSDLQQGAVLTIPPIDQVRTIGAAEAEREYARQIEEWKRHRQSGQPIQCPELTHTAHESTAQSRQDIKAGPDDISTESPQGTVDLNAVMPPSDTSLSEKTDVTAASDRPEPTAIAENNAAVAQNVSVEASPSQRENESEALLQTVDDSADATVASAAAVHSRKTIQWAEMWNDNSLLYVITMSLIVTVIFVSGRLIRPK